MSVGMKAGSGTALCDDVLQEGLHHTITVLARPALNSAKLCAASSCNLAGA